MPTPQNGQIWSDYTWRRDTHVAIPRDRAQCTQILEGPPYLIPTWFDIE